MEYNKPLPLPDVETQEFWDACRRHELRAQQCVSCQVFRWPPQGMCPKCHSWESDWVLLKGTGVIRSYTVPHYAVDKSFAEDIPYVVGHVELDGTGGKVQMVSNIVGATWKEVQVGMRTEVCFDDVTEQCTLPKFRLLDKRNDADEVSDC